MVTEKGIFVSKPGQSVGEQTKVYEYQLISTRGALLEKEEVISYNPGGFINHDTRGAIPLVLSFRIDDDGFAHAAFAPTIDSSQVQINLFANYFVRIFYNQETP